MELQAPSHWQTIDFISDLHLHSSGTATFDAWSQYMRSTTADAIFMLGDLFEVWVGDDILNTDGFERQCSAVIADAASRADVFILHGNRDFLMGLRLMEQAHTTLLNDPTVLDFGGQRWVLTHGDALCLDDTDYLAFRAQVRSSDWQREFLEKPLEERLRIARAMRSQSEQRKHSEVAYADVDFTAADTLLQTSRAAAMIHGHTHRPGCHALGDGRQRWVLSDWEFDGKVARADVLRVSAKPGASGPVRIQRIAPSSAGAMQPD